MFHHYKSAAEILLGFQANNTKKLFCSQVQLPEMDQVRNILSKEVETEFIMNRQIMPKTNKSKIDMQQGQKQKNAGTTAHRVEKRREQRDILLIRQEKQDNKTRAGRTLQRRKRNKDKKC